MTRLKILFWLIFFWGFSSLPLFCPANTNVASGNWYYSGGTSPNVEPSHVTGSPFANDVRWGASITVPKGGRITKVGVKIEADSGISDLKLALYQSDAAYPTSSLDQPGAGCSTCPFAAPVGTGWVDCTLTTPYYFRTSYTVIPFAMNSQTNGVTPYVATSGTKYTQSGLTYANFPSVYGSYDTAAGAIAMRIYVEDECLGDPAQNAAHDWTAYDPSLACVNDVVQMHAAREDTVRIPAGSATWNDSLYTYTGIVLQGAGIDTTTITQGGNSIIFWQPDPTARTTNEKFELTGLTLDGNSRTPDIGIVTLQNGDVNHPSSKVKIWSNKFKNTEKSALYLSGTIYGVAYSNLFDRVGAPIKVEGSNDSAWHYLSRAYGRADNFYFEDNTISFSSPGLGSNSGGTTSGQGGRLVTRYNTFALANDPDGDFLDVHGLQASSPPGTDTTCQSYASMVAENYGNIITDAPPISPRWMYYRGSWLLMFNNTITYTGPAHGIGIGQYGCDSCAAWGYGTGQAVNNSYFWNNVANGSTNMMASVTLDYCTGDPRTENTHFWNYNTSCTSTGCSAGIGCGSSVPTGTCNTGVGYWVTSASPCSAPPSTMADMKRFTQAGTFYKCTAPNNWTAYYTPYTYPHPLRGEAPDVTAPVAPTGFSVR